MGMMKRAFWDNIVPIRPEVDVTPVKALGDWWARARGQMRWQPIETYDRLDSDLALASPVVLRHGEIWHFGAWVEGEWREVTDGASWALDDFEPSQWAEPSLADFIMLHHG